MKIKINTQVSVFIVVLLCLSLTSFYKNNDRYLVVPLTNPDRPGYLTLNLAKGNVQVVGYDGKNIIVDVMRYNYKNIMKDGKINLTTGSDQQQNTQNLKFKYLKVLESNNNVKIELTTKNHNTDLVIRVPRRFSLKLLTMDNGNIIVDNVEGNFNAVSVDGNIKIRDIQGPAQISTNGGNIDVSYKNTVFKTPISFISRSGKINIDLQSDTKASLKIIGNQNRLHSDFAVETNTIMKEYDNISQNSKKWVNKTINGGGSTISIENLYGNTHIRKLKTYKSLK